MILPSIGKYCRPLYKSTWISGWKFNCYFLLNIQDKISQAIDNNEYFIGLFLHLSKAFNSVDHNILFKKLEPYGIRGLPLRWFEDYANRPNRQQKVQCNTKRSTLRLLIY